MKKNKSDCPSTSSSDSDDDDEEVKKLREAVAPSFSIQSPHCSSSTSKKIKANGGEKAENESFQMESLPSNRPDIKNGDEKWNSGHFESIEISIDAQKHVAKKLAAALDTQIREKVEEGEKTEQEPAEDSDDSNGILLFTESTSKFTRSDFKSSANQSESHIRLKQHKARRRKRRLADDAESDDELSKLQAVAVSSEWVLSANAKTKN